MNKSIKNGFLFGLTAFTTLIIAGLTYAAVSNTVSNSDTLTAGMWNEMAGNYQYDTNTDINTGKKWVDGRDIFRKTMIINGTLVDEQNKEKIHSTGLTTVSDIINMDFTSYKGEFVNTAGSNRQQDEIIFKIVGGEYRLRSYNSESTWNQVTKTIVIIEYTKI